MILSKTDSIALIRRRLKAVTDALGGVDAANATKDTLDADLAQLRATETDLLASDATKPQKLVAHRAEIDLLVAKIERADKALRLAEEVAVRAAEIAAQLIYAFKNAAIESYYVTMEAKTQAYFDSRDLQIVKQLSARSPAGRSIHEHEEFNFQPSSLQQRALNLHDARRMPLAFENLEKAASDLDVQLDIPHTLLD
jgi:hypothetical protein